MKMHSRRALTGAILLGVAIILIAWQYFSPQPDEELIADCIQFGLDSELQAMGEKGDYAGAVHRMEEACDAFHEAKARLGEKYRIPDHPMASGLSFLFTTLVADNSDWYMANLPRTLADFFCRTSDPSEGLPKHWAPFAREMVTSRSPMLRTIGAWFLGDLDGFAAEVFAQVDAGDSSYFRLEYIASYMDPVLHRGFPRLVAYAKRNDFANEESRYHRQASYLFYQLGPKALASGMVSDEDLKYAREFALKYEKNPKSYGSTDRPEFKWEREFLGGGFLHCN